MKSTKSPVVETILKFLPKLPFIEISKGINFSVEVEKTPPNDIELLAKSPDGTIHLCNWREAYDIFTVQDKTDDSHDWQWKLI